MSSTTHFKARPTVYKGIEMRSRLEAGFAAWLDWAHFRWEYEPKAFAADGGQYLPDFLIEEIEMDGLSYRAYFEIKPTIPEDPLKLRKRMTVIWESDPEAALLLVTPNMVTKKNLPGVLVVAPDDGWYYAEWVFSAICPFVALATPISPKEAPLADGFWDI